MSEKRKSLVEQALLGRKSSIVRSLSSEDKEEIDLYVAWIDGTLETTDVQRVSRAKHLSGVYARAATSMRKGVRGGYLKLTKQEPLPPVQAAPPRKRAPKAKEVAAQ